MSFCYHHMKNCTVASYAKYSHSEIWFFSKNRDDRIFSMWSGWYTTIVVWPSSEKVIWGWLYACLSNSSEKGSFSFFILNYFFLYSHILHRDMPLIFLPNLQGANFRDLPGTIIDANNTVQLDPSKERILLPSGRPLVGYVLVFLLWNGSNLCCLWSYETVWLILITCYFWSSCDLSSRKFALLVHVR